MSIQRWTDKQVDQLAFKVESLSEQHSKAVRTVDEFSKKVIRIVEHQEGMALSQEKMLSLIERMGLQQEQIIEAQALLTENQASLANSIRQLADSQMQMTRVIENIQNQLDSTRAAVERLDCIMDYLMKRDGERDKDNAKEDIDTD